MTNDIRQAVILAAGRGTRLHPLTLTVPKPMIEVAGRTILERKMDQLPDRITDVVLVVGYLQERIRERFGDGWNGRRITYVEQPELKGTYDALLRCGSVLDSRFLVLNGDDLYARNDIEEAIRHDLAVGALPTANPGRYGSLVTDEKGCLKGIAENGALPETPLVNIGLYVLDARIFGYPPVAIKGGKEYGLPQTLARMAQDIPVAVTRASFWMPIGTPEELTEAESLFREHTDAHGARL